jgi:hypothetical protein
MTPAQLADHVADAQIFINISILLNDYFNGSKVGRDVSACKWGDTAHSLLEFVCFT